MLGNKHIPELFLQNSKEVRIKVLAGLIDSDGYKDTNVYECTQKSVRLAEDIKKLANSLGIFVTVRPRLACATNTADKKMCEYQRIHLYTLGLDIPVLLQRKSVTEPKHIHGITMNTEVKNARSEWSDDMRKRLIECVNDPDNKKGTRIQWKKIYEENDIFQKSTAESLRTIYNKMMKNK
jgi:intein/homing endonuclease